MPGIDVLLDNPRSLIQNGILPELTANLGQSIFALIIGSAVLMMLYYASDGRWGPPAVVLTLSGAWLTSQVPEQFSSFAQSLILIGLVAGLFTVAERFFLRPEA